MGHRCDLDQVLLWLWPTPAAAAPIGPLAWEPPYAKSEALKSQERNVSCDVLRNKALKVLVHSINFSDLQLRKKRTEMRKMVNGTMK